MSQPFNLRLNVGTKEEQLIMNETNNSAPNADNTNNTIAKADNASIISTTSSSPSLDSWSDTDDDEIDADGLHDAEFEDCNDGDSELRPTQERRRQAFQMIFGLLIMVVVELRNNKDKDRDIRLRKFGPELKKLENECFALLEYAERMGQELDSAWKTIAQLAERLEDANNVAATSEPETEDLLVHSSSVDLEHGMSDAESDSGSRQEQNPSDAESQAEFENEDESHSLACSEDCESLIELEKKVHECTMTRFCELRDQLNEPEEVIIAFIRAIGEGRYRAWTTAADLADAMENSGVHELDENETSEFQGNAASEIQDHSVDSTANSVAQTAITPPLPSSSFGHANDPAATHALQLTTAADGYFERRYLGHVVFSCLTRSGLRRSSWPMGKAQSLKSRHSEVSWRSQVL